MCFPLLFVMVQNTNYIKTLYQTDNHTGQTNDKAQIHIVALSGRGKDLENHTLQSNLEAICNQEEEGLSRFYDLTINSVYGLALRITGSDQDAEEVVSDVYLQVWEQATCFQAEKGSIMAWLLTICRSRAIDLLRKHQRSSNELNSETPPDPVDISANPEYFVSHLQKNSQVYHALQHLSIEQRQILALAFFRGMSHGEIATHISMPLGTVKSHVRRALNSLHTNSGLLLNYTVDGEHPYD